MHFPWCSPPTLTHLRHLTCSHSERCWSPVRAGLGFALLCLAACASSGCGGTGGGCTADVHRAIEVSVYDAQTRQPAISGAAATVRDGFYSETLREVAWTLVDPSDPTSPLLPLTLGGADERSGTYTIRVEKPGYVTWEKTGVRVRRNECHVEGVHLDVYLTPMP